jgi:hypothetical protein
MKLRQFRFAIVSSITSCALAASAFAATIVAEPFDYLAGSLSGTTGGTGWTTSWAGGSTNVTNPGLTFMGDGTGNKLTINNDNNGAFRSLPAQGTDGTTVWLGYYAAGTGAPVAGGYAGLSLFQGASENLFTGKRTGQTVWGAQRSGGGQSGNSSTVADPSTHFLVYKIEFGLGVTSGNERVTMYVDPTLGLTDPDVAPALTLTDVTNFAFDRIRLQSGNGSSFSADEIRLGTDFVSIPEPSVFGALLLGANCLAGRRRRRAFES